MIGIDIVSIQRISKLKERFGVKFLRRFLSENEISIIKSDKTLAGFWAVKEAASKALGVGIGLEFGFDDIVIYKDNKNAPKIKFSDKIQKNFNLKQVDVSITHDGGFAVAVVMIQKYDS